jgi:hypothetical protein
MILERIEHLMSAYFFLREFRKMIALAAIIAMDFFYFRSL